MKRIIFILLIILLSGFYANAQNNFEKYFESTQLRFDYYRTGTHDTCFISLDEIIKEKYWGGSETNLIDTFDFGKYKFYVLDAETKEVIYTRHYSSLFGEWQRTEEGKTEMRTFDESVVMPFPKNKVIIEFYERDHYTNKWQKQYTYNIDPESIFIKQGLEHDWQSFDVVIGDKKASTANTLDIVFVPEGYTQKEMGKFKDDCQKFARYLINAEPFKTYKTKISIRGVLAPSMESGTDVPGTNIWVNTVMNSSFFTLQSERYLMTSNFQAVRDVAAYAPYDQIVIIANFDKYGGGGIYNYYSTVTSGNPYCDFVIIHEFGHGFAGLADEYVEEGSSVQEFYPLNLEPWEPNITTLVDFGSKWEDMLDENTAIPSVTDPESEELGVYEGAGYAKEKIYRPRYNCTMRAIAYDYFCPVCSKAIVEMLNFYCD